VAKSVLNRGAEQLYGWQAAEVLGKNIELLNRETTTAEIIALKTVIETGEGEVSYQSFNVRESLGTAVDEAGKPAIDRRHRYRKKTTEAQFLTQRLESVGTLIAHDLNTISSRPLAVARDATAEVSRRR